MSEFGANIPEYRPRPSARKSRCHQPRLGCERELSLDSAAAEDLERDVPLDVGSIAVHGADPVGANRARALALWPVHPEIQVTIAS
jgi:hypothetical protein